VLPDGGDDDCADTAAGGTVTGSAGAAIGGVIAIGAETGAALRTIVRS
jgi:hypothetical protein